MFGVDRKLIFSITVALVTVFSITLIPTDAFAQALRVLTGPQGGTGIGTATGGDIGTCLKVLSVSPLTYELGACGTGGGSGSTDTLFNWNTGTNIISTDGSSTTATTSFSTNGFTANNATITNATSTTGWFSSMVRALNAVFTNATSTALGTSEFRALSSSGISIHSNSGSEIANFGAGGGTNATFNGGVNITGALGITGNTSLTTFTANSGTTTSASSTNLFSTQGRFNTLCLTGDKCLTTWPVSFATTSDFSNTYAVYSTGANTFADMQSTTDAVRWMTGTGNTLLVGTSSASSAKLEVRNQDGTSTRGLLRIISNSASGADYDIRIDSPDGDIEFCDQVTRPAGCFEINAVAGNNQLYFTPRAGSDSGFLYPTLTIHRDSSTGWGSVGIGTQYDTPGGTLELAGSTTVSNILAVTDVRGGTDGNVIMVKQATGFVGLGSTTPSRRLTVSGDALFANTYATGTASSTNASTTALSLFGRLFDRTQSAGTNGMVLQTTGSGVQWVATSSLGITGGSGSPGGSNTQIQFNNSGSFGGADLNYVLTAGDSFIKVPDETVSNTNGSSLDITAANGNGTNFPGGTVSISGGTSGVSGGNQSAGGRVELRGGDALNANEGGPVWFFGGDGNPNGGDGGDILFDGGIASGTGQIAGDVYMDAGYGNSGASGGRVIIAGGDNTDASGNGGDVWLQGGNGLVPGVVKIDNAKSGIFAKLDVSLINTSDKTFTFPNTTGTLALTSDIVDDWIYNGSALVPSTTVGISLSASSTIQNLSAVNSTTTNATTTSLAVTSLANCDVKTNANGVAYCGTDATGGGGSGSIATSSDLTNTYALYATAANTIADMQGSTDAVRWLTGTGNTLLVGTSSASSAKLEINNQDYTSTRGMLRIISESSSGGDYDIRLDSPDADIEFCDETARPEGCFEINSVAANNQLYISPRNGANTGFLNPIFTVNRTTGTGAANIGIGTRYDIPEATLEIAASSTDTNILALTSAQGATAGNRLIVKSATGFVGIGQTSPNVMLHIATSSGSATYNFQTIENTGAFAEGGAGVLFRNSAGSIDMARFYARPGSSYTDPSFRIQVADSSKTLRDRIVLDASGMASTTALRTASSTIDNATTTNLVANATFKMGGDIFTDMTGFGMANSGGLLGIDTTGAADGECLTYASAGPSINWASCGGAGGSKWTDSGLMTYLTNTTYDLALGSSATETAPFWWDVSASQQFVGAQGGTDAMITFGTSTPWTIGFDDTDDSFNIASSTVLGLNQFIHAFSTTTILETGVTALLDMDNDTGVRMNFGGNDYDGSANLDQFTFHGRIKNDDWYNFSCPYAMSFTQITSDTRTAAGIGGSCDGFEFDEDATAYMDSYFGGGYTASQLGSITANDGAGFWVQSANSGVGWIRLATSTPSFEVTARIGTIAANSSTTSYYIGHSNETINGGGYETEPTQGCYFVASTTQANWRAVCQSATAKTNTDTGVSSTTLAAGVGAWRTFRIDTDFDEARFYIKQPSGGFVLVANPTGSSVPTTTNMNTGIWFGRTTGTQAIQFQFMGVEFWWRKFLPNI